MGVATSCPPPTSPWAGSRAPVQLVGDGWVGSVVVLTLPCGFAGQRAPRTTGKYRPQASLDVDRVLPGVLTAVGLSPTSFPQGEAGVSGLPGGSGLRGPPVSNNCPRPSPSPNVGSGWDQAARGCSEFCPCPAGTLWIARPPWPPWPPWPPGKYWVGLESASHWPGPCFPEQGRAGHGARGQVCSLAGWAGQRGLGTCDANIEDWFVCHTPSARRYQ